MSLRPMLIAAALATLSAPVFADDKGGSPERLALAEAHAGEAVDYARFTRPNRGYEVLDKHALLVWEGYNRAWLVKVREDGNCQGFRNGVNISLERQMYRTINVETGYVRSPRDHSFCKITELRELDVAAWRDAKRAGSIATR